MHEDFVSYLALCMFFPFPSAPVESHLSLEKNKEDDSCEHINVKNESELLHSQWNEREKGGTKDGQAPGQTVRERWMCRSERN